MRITEPPVIGWIRRSLTLTLVRRISSCVLSSSIGTGIGRDVGRVVVGAEVGSGVGGGVGGTVASSDPAGAIRFARCPFKVRSAFKFSDSASNAPDSSAGGLSFRGI